MRSKALRQGSVPQSLQGRSEALEAGAPAPAEDVRSAGVRPDLQGEGAVSEPLQPHVAQAPAAVRKGGVIHLLLRAHDDVSVGWCGVVVANDQVTTDCAEVTCDRKGCVNEADKRFEDRRRVSNLRW